MDPIDAIPEAPFERFQAIYGELAVARHAWEHPAWLRFAAQAAVAAPGDPRAVAAAIGRLAATFHADAGWADALRSPLRFVVAAMLVQAGDAAAAFEAELARARQLFREEGLAPGGIHGIVAIVLLRLAGGLGPIGRERVERLRAVYLQLEGRHWWLTGLHDLPACAALCGLPGTPEELGALVEEHHRLLREDGAAGGAPLQQAAHLLPLLRLPAQQAVRRYRALARRFASHGAPPWPGDHQALAVLAFLDHDAEAVVARALDTYRRLEALRPPLPHQALMDLAADLAFLDLVHHDRRRLHPDDATARGALERTLRDQQAAAAVIACSGASAIDPASY
jgi:hypothetical protein